MISVTRLTHVMLGLVAWVEGGLALRGLGGALSRHEWLAAVGLAPATLVLAAIGLWLTETLWLKPYRPEPQPAAER